MTCSDSSLETQTALSDMVQNHLMQLLCLVALDLFKTNSIARHDVDEAQTEKALADMSYQEASENKRLAELELRRATAALHLHTIRSPINGVVVDRLLSPGELARQTPNLSVSVLGNEDQPKFSVRGISQSAFDLNASSPTGIFYDEIFVRSSFLGGAQLFDMDRVEVLRGPQGTLFGKETVGGAVSYITRAPQFDTLGYLSGEYGNYNYVGLQGAANTQIIDDKLAV